MSYLLAYNPYNTNLFMKNRSIDPAAQLYFNATGITGDAQQQAINNLVKSLKQSGLWSKMKAVYPFVTDNRNLLSYTNTLTQTSYWNQVSVTLTGNQTDPVGGTNATRIVGTGAASLYGLISLTVGATYTLSCYVKSTSGSNQTFRIYANGGSPFSPNLTATSTWQQVTLTFTAIAGTNSFGITRDSSTNNFDILAYGIQMEAGSTATTYQPIATTQQAFISSQFKYNLKDPRDTDAAFRLVFNGGWSFSSTGATPNGVNGYADTRLNVLSTLANYNVHMSLYNRTQSSGNILDIGAGYIGGENYQGEIWRTFSTISRTTNAIQAIDAERLFFNYTGTPNIQANYIWNTPSQSKQTIFRNSAKLVEATTTLTSSPRPNTNIYIGALLLNGNSNPTLFSNRETAFATIGDGLTDNDATNLYYYTQVFQTTLGRQVGSPAYALPAVSDINAKLYLSAIGSTTDSTLNNAVDTFIKGLKADGIYSKMKAVYPFATDNRNISSFTEDFSNGAWLQENVVITANSALSPNNTLTADTLSEGSTLNFHNIRQIPPALSGSNIVFSVYINKNTARYVRLILSGGNSAVWTAAQFDLDTLTYTGGAGTGATGSFVSASITQASNGFYRCEIVSSLGGVNITNSWISLSDGSAIVNTNNFGRVSYQGTNKSVYLWGSQLEIGSTATAYQPMLGSQQSYISNQFKYNMVNSQDDDSAFRLVFNGGWTFSSTGALPNGTNGYADTKLVPSSVFSNANNSGASIYQTNPPTVFSHGCFDSNSRMFAQLNMTEFDARMNTTAAVVYKIPYVNNGIGMVTTSRNTSDNVRAFKNGSFINQVTVDSQLVGVSSFVGARNANGIASEYDNTIQKFLAYHNGLTDTEAANLYTRVQTFNQSLSRQVGVPIVSDADAQAFLNSAEITDITQANAINTLVTDLKAQGLWTKMKAIYPFVGGTASTHKWNLKDPRDLDAAYRLVFNGGWTHSSTGATPNGTNGYADTYLIPSTSLTAHNIHLSYYSRTNSAVSSSNTMGSASSEYCRLVVRRTSDIAYNIISDATVGLSQYTVTDSRGLFVANAPSINTRKFYQNGVAKTPVSQTTLGTNGLSTNKIVLAANNYGVIVEYDNKQTAFASIGDGLTDAEALALYNTVNNYQVALSRNV